MELRKKLYPSSEEGELIRSEIKQHQLEEANKLEIYRNARYKYVRGYESKYSGKMQ